MRCSAWLRAMAVVSPAVRKPGTQPPPLFFRTCTFVFVPVTSGHRTAAVPRAHFCVPDRRKGTGKTQRDIPLSLPLSFFLFLINDIEATVNSFTHLFIIECIGVALVSKIIYVSGVPCYIVRHLHIVLCAHHPRACPFPRFSWKPHPETSTYI